MPFPTLRQWLPCLLQEAIPTGPERGDGTWPLQLLIRLGFALSAYFKNPYLAMAALTLAFVGLKSTLGPFWALGTAFLSGTAAAGGIALINSVGNLGGFVGPMLVGIITDRTGSTGTSLLILGSALLLMGLLVLTIRRNTNKD